ncbi:MAG: hemolysin family protein [Lachnospiraceae bacterium]|nr:hemolysin family protein [Lachnospiraceae bacterium]
MGIGIALALMVLVVAFFYGSGAAFEELNCKEIDNLEEQGDVKAKQINKILESPSAFINTVLFVSTICVLLSGGIICFYMSQQLLPAAVIFTCVYLCFGIILPKKLAGRFAVSWSNAVISPILFCVMICRPFTWTFSMVVKVVLRICGIKDDRDEADVTEEEILSMVNEGHEQGVIEANEAEMINNVFEFWDKQAQDIMTHRNNISGVDGSMKFQDAIDFMLGESFSRFPVFDDNIDHVLGILYFKDAMRMHMEDDILNLPIKDVPNLLREPVFMPETKNINDIFKNMQLTKNQMVVVVDEYGQTAGLITMEDILEEIVGNILDEYDEEEFYIQENGQDEYVIEGKTPLEDLEERLHIDFGETEFETINGFMISKLDHIPEPEEEFDFDYGGYNFKLLGVENKVISSVLVTKIKKTGIGENTENTTDTDHNLREEYEQCTLVNDVTPTYQK